MVDDTQKNILDSNRIGRLLFKLTIPAFIGMLVTTLYNVIDTIFVGNYVGPLGIAGLSIVQPLQMLAMGIGNITGIGGASFISRLIGAKDNSRAEHTLGNANILTVFISLTVTIAGLSNTDAWLILMGSSDTILPYARDYMNIILIGIVFQAFALSQNHLIRAEGDSKTAMIGMIIGAGLNVILDAFFIIILDMGVRGAAIATVIAQLFSVLYFLRYFFLGKSYLKIHAGCFAIDWSIVRGIMSIGISAFALSLGISLSIIIANRVLLAQGGDLAIATWGILSRIMMFAVMPGTVIGQGLQPIIGFNYGARRYGLVIRAIKMATLVATGFHLMSFIIIYFFPRSLMGLFTNDSELISLSSYASRMVFIAILFMGYFYVSQTVFVAMGKAVRALLTSSSRQIIFLIPLLFILPGFWQLNGVWLAFPLSDGLACVLVTILLIPQIKTLLKGMRTYGEDDTS